MSRINMRTIIHCALALGLAVGSSAQELTPEQQAVFDEMIRSTGGDPELVNAARRNAQSAARFTDVVRYSVIGVYQARTNVSADANWMAFADVGDRVELQFDWKLSEGRMVGAASVQNHAATLANPRNPEAKCAPPTINGPFEYDLRTVEHGLSANLRMQMQTRFPPVQVHQFCTGALKAIPAKNSMGQIEIMVPPPTMLTMQLPAGGDVTRSADGKSLVIQQGGWRWSFTPRAK